MRWEQKVQSAADSDIGLRRKNNQDAFTVQFSSSVEDWQRRGHLFIVADGMGGHAVGELASKMAVDSIPLTYFKSRNESIAEALTEAIEKANAEIHQRGMENRDFNRMGTTCVALVLCHKGAIVGHVGDSRCYRVRGDRIEQLTFDHSLEWELTRAGRLKPGEAFLPEAKHVITRSLGPEPAADVDIDGPFIVFPGDRFLLCSDGLTGHVPDHEIGMIVHSLPPDEAARLLINLANMRGGSDNVTVVIADCGPLPEGGAAPAPETPQQPVEPAVGAFWMLFFWLTILVIGIGAVLIATRHWIGGGVFTGLGAASLFALIAHWQRKRPVPMGNMPDTEIPPQTYREASARPTQEFLAGLARLKRELRELAADENWTIDWPAHDRAVAAAREALDRKHVARAMSEIGKAVDCLMTGLHAHRKKVRLAKMASEHAEADQRAAEQLAAELREAEQAEVTEHDAELSED
ncbi:serine/threonine-protein phosphatase [bacterium]|nr:serine/threonine-protein phosphatase [bacterium]